ncbi:type II toxin-antitoxin system VapC family toxin [Candidatus Scalindua japonica]|uniref:type II toxin-antitoxin system VapC family toxin n=1 Tax=Candidatus Scalindua japonica TaxID=1284222 RepID=UPI0013A53F20|nr:type II toxin-antitoxin system VapC family toxin [Candidatus Scalindua japonica]
MFRRFRNREIDEGRLEVAIEAFEEQMTLFNVEPLTHSVIKESERLLRGAW